MSCEDQACGPTDTCVKWPCYGTELVKRGRYWVCPKCLGSYGENPSPTKGRGQSGSAPQKEKET